MGCVWDEQGLTHDYSVLTACLNWLLFGRLFFLGTCHLWVPSGRPVCLYQMSIMGDHPLSTPTLCPSFDWLCHFHGRRPDRKLCCYSPFSIHLSRPVSQPLPPAISLSRAVVKWNRYVWARCSCAGLVQLTVMANICLLVAGVLNDNSIINY